MYVNPFWFGVLMTILAGLVVVMIIAWANTRRMEDEEEISEKEYKELLEEMTGKKFKIHVKNGYMVGEPIEDADDDEEQKQS